MDIKEIKKNCYQISNLEDKDYFSFKAISSHTLIDIIKSGFDVEIASMPKNLPARALNLGSVVHGCVLEPGNIIDICNRNYENLAIPDDLGNLMSFQYALMKNDFTRELFQRTQNEETFVHSREGKASIKGKVDAVCLDSGTIYDLKTISNIKYMNSHIKNFGYLFQGVVYTELLKKVFGKDFTFTWVFLCKKTLEIVVKECKPEQEHYEKVSQAIEAYDKYHKESKFDALPSESKKSELLF